MCTETTQRGVDSPSLPFPSMNLRSKSPKLFLESNIQQKTILCQVDML